jgi:hypothetical protein
MGVFLYFIDSIYSVYLAKEFGIGPDLIGYIYIPPLLIYIILCPFISKLNEKFENRVFIVFGFAIMYIALTLSGPSEIMHIPSKFYIILIGYTLIYVGSLFLLVAALPDLMENIGK